MLIGFLTDIHDDAENLQIALDYLQKKKVSRLFCAGDITGHSLQHYSNRHKREPDTCIDLVRDQCDGTVAGNHDLHAIRKTPPGKCGFPFPENWYYLTLEEREQLARGAVWLYEDEVGQPPKTEQNKDFLDNLPDEHIWDGKNIRMLMSHFLYPDKTGSCVHPPPDEKQLAAHIRYQEEKKCHISFFGHTHTEGLLLFSKNKLKYLDYGSYKIPSYPAAFGLPCITSGKNESGIAIWDTERELITVNRINKKRLT